MEKTTRRKQLDSLLVRLSETSETDLIVLEATARGIMQAKTAEEA